jgi:hypothetical protein
MEPVQKRKRPNQPSLTARGESSGSNPKRAKMVAPEPPAVLTRDKKQKACANCRRAKLKCIVAGDQADCVRCLSRKEKCVFYPRTLVSFSLPTQDDELMYEDEDWQQNLQHDVSTAMSHLADVSAAVHHLISHLTEKGTIPPYITSRGSPLDWYDAPERDIPGVQGWDADRNRKIIGPGEWKPNGDEAETADEPDISESLEGRIPPSTIKRGRARKGENPLTTRKPHWHARPPEHNHPSNEPDNWSDETPMTHDQLISPRIQQSRLIQHSSLHRPTLSLASSRQVSCSNHDANSTPHSAGLHTPNLARFPHSGDDQPSSSSIAVSPRVYDGPLVPKGCILGADDPRSDVITDRVVTPEDAIELVNQ